jgi:hypothetical protein
MVSQKMFMLKGVCDNVLGVYVSHNSLHSKIS